MTRLQISVVCCSAITFLLNVGAVRSDDFGVGIRDFPARMQAQFRVIGDHALIRLDNCLDGGESKRTVCTYKVGDYMVAMSAGEAGSTKLSDLTLICTAQEQLAATRCIVAYGIAIAAFVPSIEREDRGKIIKALFGGVDVGDSIQLKKDGRQFILQRVVGSLWFHIEASGS